MLLRINHLKVLVLHDITGKNLYFQVYFSSIKSEGFLSLLRKKAL